MSRPKIFECIPCEASFKLAHDMSDSHYIESYCVFCGSELEQEDAMPLNEWDEEEANNAVGDEW